MAGNFDTKVTLFLGPEQTMQSKGVMKRQMVLNGLYLKEDYEGPFMGMEFKGMGITGFDQNQKKYVGTWIDSMSSGIMMSQGVYDPKTKTLTMAGEDFDPELNKKVRTRDVLKIVSADEQQSEMYRSPEPGKEMKIMEIRFTLQGKANEKK
jgi:hypothetical protein